MNIAAADTYQIERSSTASATGPAIASERGIVMPMREFCRAKTLPCMSLATADCIIAPRGALSMALHRPETNRIDTASRKRPSVVKPKIKTETACSMMLVRVVPPTRSGICSSPTCPSARRRSYAKTWRRWGRCGSGMWTKPRWSWSRRPKPWRIRAKSSCPTIRATTS